MYFHDSTLPEAGNQDSERTATLSDVIIGLYAFSPDRRERFYRSICRRPANPAASRRDGVSPRHEACPRRCGRSSRRPQPTHRQRSRTQALRSGCCHRPDHQLSFASGRAHEHFPRRDPTRRHAEQHGRIPRRRHFARHGNRTAARAASHGRLGAAPQPASLSAREHADSAQNVRLGHRRLR